MSFSFFSKPLRLYELKKKDQKLIKELEQQDIDRKSRENRVQKHKTRNRFLAPILKDAPKNKPLSKKTVQQINKYLEKKDTFRINLLDLPWKDTDQNTTVWQKEKITTLRIAKAAETTQWPMGHQIWIRDLVRIARCTLQSARLNNRSKKEGLHLLMSALTVMSSVTQLKRFRAVIQASEKNFINDKKNWPSIFISQDDLASEKNINWAQKQDAFQMLALELIDAFEKEELSADDLTQKQKEWLKRLIPFLAKIEFWKQPNSGSWEELEAVRTSVVALDTLLIYKLSELAKKKEFSFIKEAYTQKKKNFSDTIEMLLEKGTKRLLKKDNSLVIEECLYPQTEPRFRSADATLIYLLDYAVLNFLAERKGFSENWIQTQEKKLLQQIETLTDPQTGGIKRYLSDAYMDGDNQHSYFDNQTNYVLATKVYLNDKKKTVSGANEAGTAQFLNRRNVVSGNTQSEAAWVHPVAQISSWAGQRYLETKDSFYRNIQHKFYRRLLNLITDKNEKTISNEGAKNTSIVKSIREACVPEAYITIPTSNGKSLRCPCPHTPLNWAIAESIRATAYVEENLK